MPPIFTKLSSSCLELHIYNPPNYGPEGPITKSGSEKQSSTPSLWGSIKKHGEAGVEKLLQCLLSIFQVNCGH